MPLAQDIRAQAAINSVAPRSAAQIANLSSEIVRLVERDVLLLDGSKTKALVPQV